MSRYTPTKIPLQPVHSSPLLRSLNPPKYLSPLSGNHTGSLQNNMGEHSKEDHPDTVDNQFKVCIPTVSDYI